MNTLWQDLRFGARMLLKQPGFTAIAVLTLALGIGANTAIFSVVNAALLRSLPYENAEELVAVYTHTNNGPRDFVAWADLVDWRAQSQAFEQLAAFVPQSVNLTARAGSQIEPGRVIGGFVSTDFFALFKVNAVQGRGFLPGEDAVGAERVAVISYETWRDRFGADPQLIGQALTLNNQPFTVVGVLPAGFRAPYSEIEVWLPLPAYPNFSPERKSPSAGVFGRLKPGVSLQQAQTDLATVAARLAQQYPATNKDRSVSLVELQALVVEQLRPSLLVLFGAVGCVLLIACANVANLMLCRAVGRTRELALRAALGASRWQLLRQLLTESLLLALVSGVLGLLIGVWGMDALATNSAANLPGLVEVKLDRTVFGFTLSVALLTGLLFGLLPAWRFSRPDLNDALKEGSARTGGPSSGKRLRGLLVVGQVALSLVLLLGAGLLIRSFVNLLGVNPGFDPHNVLTLEYRVPRNKYPEPQQQWRFHEQVVARLQALPGVEAAAAVGAIPHGGNASSTSFTLPEQAAPPAGQEPRAQTNRADANYFHAMKIPVLQGRGFTAQDQPQAPPVVVINQTMARQFWPTGDAVGRQVHLLSPDLIATVVGVVGDVRHLSLDEPAQPQIYLPYAQHPHIFASLVIRTQGDANGYANAVRAAIWSIDSEQPVWKVRTLEWLLNRSLGGQRLLLQLLGTLAALALLLAAVGIYGVIAYSVSQQTHEIGIRLALGAQASDILRLIVGHGAALTLLGIALGLFAALGLTRLLQGLLFEVSATDPLTFGAVALLLTLVALMACWLPARRATKVDPLVALRYE